MEKSRRGTRRSISALRRSEAVRRWDAMGGAAISSAARRRLVAHIEENRKRIVSSVLAISTLGLSTSDGRTSHGSTPGQRLASVATSLFVNEFLDGFTRELMAAGDAEPLDAWIDALSVPDTGEASFRPRLVLVMCAMIAAFYARSVGSDPDIPAFLTIRSHEIARRLEGRAFEREPSEGRAASNGARRDRSIPSTVAPKTTDRDSVRRLQPAADSEPTTRDEVLAALLATLEARDPGTADHSRAVGAWCRRIAGALHLSTEQQAFAELCGTLHDVGKVKTAEEIIRKPGPLNDLEWFDMHAHARVGARLLEQIPCLKDVAPIVRAHHERIDGRGYPDRLSGEEIPLVARIVAVADAFHSMTTGSNYREALSIGEGFDALVAGRGTQFDPVVVDAFVMLLCKEHGKAS